MSYKKISEQDINFFKKICGENHVILGEKINLDLCKTQFEQMHFLPEVVVQPKTSKALTEIMKYAFDNKIPLTPKQSETEVIGGILINMSNYDNVVELDEQNLTEWFR